MGGGLTSRGPRRRAGLVLVVLAAFAAGPRGSQEAAPPVALTSAEFWALVGDLSEPGGSFRSDNLVSNEVAYQHVIPGLLRVAPRGAYVGVGPDQNFTYIAALQPEMAFVVDVRRGNLHLHLLYKALFELSPTRAEFVARLFGRGLAEPGDGENETAALLDEVEGTAASPVAAETARAAVLDRLTSHHGFPLTPADRAAIGALHATFVRYGPALTYGTSAGEVERGAPSFADLQRASDLSGRAHAFLATEEAYAAVRRRQLANAIVPVVGDFAGARALRAVARWIEARGMVLSAFYASNVEEYLFGDGRWPTFYENLAMMPRQEHSLLIRSTSGSSRLDPILSLLADVRSGRIRTYADITGRVGIR